jgi:phosphate uptake regulator
MSAFAKAETALAEDVIKMDDEVDRFSVYMMRSLNLAAQDGRILLEVGLKKPSDCLGYRTVIKCIERIADHGVLIAKRIKFLEPPIKGSLLKNIVQLSEKSLDAFNNSILSLTKKDYLLAEKIAEQISDIINEEKNLMDSLQESARNAIVVKFVLEDIRRIAEYSRDIAEVVMDENISSVITEK